MQEKLSMILRHKSLQVKTKTITSLMVLAFISQWKFCLVI
ncbi:hypothetical protein OIU79_028894 [Salix purpurea]|uniref:Uncharacterized protein n=1 Tax=Salix purpurea TaxID=77065 RepID=A0A9Q0VZL5_SALPP|nr:hypothetical protein OIU79_028894 [Salix purpurea]